MHMLVVLLFLLLLPYSRLPFTVRSPFISCRVVGCVGCEGIGVITFFRVVDLVTLGFGLEVLVVSTFSFMLASTRASISRASHSDFSCMLLSSCAQNSSASSENVSCVVETGRHG